VVDWKKKKRQYHQWHIEKSHRVDPKFLSFERIDTDDEWTALTLVEHPRFLLMIGKVETK
jgi:hypothetical protein